jgi:hypothetical protein
MSTTLASSPHAAPPSERYVRPLHRAPAGVFLLDLDGAPPAGVLLGRLSRAEQRRAEALATPLLRNRFAARRWGLRIAVAACTGADAETAPLAWDERGRPVVGDGSVRISASSADGLALVAVANGPVGVDLLHPASAPDAREACRDLPLRADAAQDATVAPERLALRLWTQLEAVVKAAGADFTIPGIAACVRAQEWNPGGPCTLRIDHPGFEGGRWRAEPLPVPEAFIATLARPA